MIVLAILIKIKLGNGYNKNTLQSTIYIQYLLIYNLKYNKVIYVNKMQLNLTQNSIQLTKKLIHKILKGILTSKIKVELGRV